MKMNLANLRFAVGLSAAMAFMAVFMWHLLIVSMSNMLAGPFLPVAHKADLRLDCAIVADMQDNMLDFVQPDMPEGC